MLNEVSGSLEGAKSLHQKESMKPGRLIWILEAIRATYGSPPYTHTLTQALNSLYDCVFEREQNNVSGGVQALVQTGLPETVMHSLSVAHRMAI